MRNGSRPSRASVGTRSKNEISSSRLIRSQSRHGAADVHGSVPGDEPRWQLRSRLLSPNATGPICRPGASWDELVTSGLGHQDSWIRRVALDLLAQSVDMGFQRVGGNAGIVSPHFLQQDLARNRALPSAIEVAQDCRLLLGQAHFVTLCIDQKLRARAKGVRSDGEHRILARLMLAQLRPDA